MTGRGPHTDDATLAIRRCPVCGGGYPSDFVLCPKDGSALEGPARPVEDPLIGKVLADTFLLSRLLGQGGMGRVYEAEHVRLPRRVAVKVIHDSLAQIPEAVARFEREAQAAASIESEHVVEVVDVVRTPLGQPCLVAELLQGEDLASLLERTGKLPIPNAITICRQVCRGLAAAHAVGVIHRDVKPSNLFLVHRPDESILVKILDFGVAKVSDGAGITRTGAVVGTPAYMAPEQARGAANVDARADVYSVGAVLYRALTGHEPFEEDEPASTLSKVLNEDPKRPREHDRSIPDPLDFLIQRAMARSPEDRPQTALALDHELATFDQGALLERNQLALQASTGSGFIGRLETVVLAADRIDAERAQRARRGRPAALGLAFGAGVAAGAAVFICAARALQVTVGRTTLTDTEKLLLGIVSGICTVTATVGALRVLASRWRSALAIERLAEGLRSAITALLSAAGALVLAWRGWALLGPPLPDEWLPWIDIGLVAAPTLLGLAILVRALQSARRRA
jgi:serine/threonine-protein kinase